MKKTFLHQNRIACLSLVVATIAWAVTLSPQISWSEDLIVTADTAAVYSQPATSATEIGIIANGDVAMKLLSREEWYAVKLSDNRLGWVLQKAFDADLPPNVPPPSLEPSPAVSFQARVTVKSGRVRNEPHIGAPVIFSLLQGAAVEVFTVKDDWYQIRLTDGRTGWAFHTLFNRIDAAPASPPTPSTIVAVPASGGTVLFQAVVTVPSGRVRQSSGIDSPVSFGVVKGEIVEVLDTRGEWYEIRAKDGDRGWAHHSLFAPRGDRPKVMGIWTETTTEGSEKLIFALNGFHPPKTFAMEDGKTPSIVCDFMETELSKDIASTVPVTGSLIQHVRVGVHETRTPFVRVVADLNPDQEYDVEQVYFKKNNYYVLTFNRVTE